MNEYDTKRLKVGNQLIIIRSGRDKEAKRIEDKSIDTNLKYRKANEHQIIRSKLSELLFFSSSFEMIKVAE